MAALIHHFDPLDPLKRNVARLDRPVTVRRLVQKHKALRQHTQVYRPGGVYGRRKVREFSRMTIALHNGKALPRSAWKRTVIKGGDVVSFVTCPDPRGGGGILRTIAMIALIAVAAAATWYVGGAGGIALAASLGVSQGVLVGVTALTFAAINIGVMSLFSQPAAETQNTGFANSTPASSPTYNLTAQGNFARLGSAIPEPLGRNRLFPDFVCSPYARYSVVDPEETPGSVASTTDQFLHHIVGLGIGEYEIDEESLKLGDTPLVNYPDVEWAVIEPGELGDTSIADERWITSADLADVELLDATEGSPWAGPYAANPAGTVIGTIEVDLAAPRGLWAYNPVSTDIDAREFTYEIEAQEIDDAGDPVGDPDDWEAMSTATVNRRSQDLQRVTVGPLALPSNGRWQVRVRRTDTKDTSLQAGHQVDWIGLRGRVIGRRRFQNMTCIALKMKSGSALNSAQSRQFNLVATRKLETWDDEAGAMTTVRTATRNPCDAFAYIARTQNGGRLRDGQIDLEALYANFEDFEENNWTFDFVFDQTLTVSDALGRVSSAVVAERVTQGGKLHLVRDVPVVAPVAMFSPRNIAPGSLAIQYQMVDSTSPDALIGTYIDQRTWKPVDITVAFDDSAQERPTRLTLYGCGNREQARAVLWHMAREDRYRRRVLGWSTAMEGLAVTYGDGISFSQDIPSYGQTLEVVDVDQSDPNAPIFTFVDPPDFSAGGTHYAAVRDSLARKAGPFVATAVEGEPLQLELAVPDPDDLPEILIGGDKERTWLQFGPGEAYAKPLKVKQVTPRDSMSAEIIAYDDDPRMYDPIPDEPEVPIGGDTDPLTIIITNDDGPVVNLRTLANDNDYSGLAVQEVNFTMASDVDVAIERGSWPAGAQITIELAGTMSGTDGAAGTAGAGGIASPTASEDGTSGGAGGTGGIALDSSTGPLTITGDGTIRGGKGGGGGGGGGGGSFYEEPGMTPVQHFLQGGNGGAGNGGAGAAGDTFSPAAAGDGGDGGAAGGYGGVGADGVAGTAGTGGSFNGAGGPGGAGGLGGKAILGIANVDLTGFTGTIIGTTV